MDVYPPPRPGTEVGLGRLPLERPSDLHRLTDAEAYLSLHQDKLVILDEVHALLGLGSLDALLAHPVAGSSLEGFAVETLINAAPRHAQAGFYRTSNGAEVDLVLDLPGHGLWAIEIKKSPSARPRRGFYSACEDLQPRERWLVHGGADVQPYPVGDGVQAIGLRALAARLQAARASVDA